MASARFLCPVGFQVTSSQLTAVGYVPGDSLLVACFPASGTQPQGSVYTYENVPETVFDGLMHAASKGSFFINQIKKQAALYPFVKQPIVPDNAFQTVLSETQYSGIAGLRARLTSFLTLSDPIGAFVALTGFENAPWAW